MASLCHLLLLPLLLALCPPHPASAKFYIERFKTVATPAAATHKAGQARNMPYIVYPGEAGSERLTFNKQTGGNQWRVEQRPRPVHHSYGYNKRLGNIEPPSAFGLTNNYGNDKYNGYTLLNKNQVKYVIPPFTPGGRVHVAFQFWVPISIGGFFVTSRDLEAALRSASPTAYLTSLFLHHVATNTSAAHLLDNLDASTVQAGVDKFLAWVLPRLNYPYSSSTNTVHTSTDKHASHNTKYTDDTTKPNEKVNQRKRTRRSPSYVKTKMKHKTRRKRSSGNVSKGRAGRFKRKPKHRGGKHRPRRAGSGTEQGSGRVRRSPQDGWVTIGGHGNKDKDESEEEPVDTTSLLLTQGATLEQPEQVQDNRLLWGNDHILTHNTLNYPRPGNHRPDLDFTSPIYFTHKPRPSSSRPSPHDNRPSSSSSYSSSYPSSPSPSRPPYPQTSFSPPDQPPFHLTSFDDLASGAAVGSGGRLRGLDVRGRLSRLDYFFSNLHLGHEDCRRRVLCEVSRDQDTYAPLSDLISTETRLPGKMQEVSQKLLTSAEGARLLSYVEAVKVGQDRSQACDAFHDRCRVRAREVINTDILPIWREVVRWLTVKVLSQDSS